MSYKCNFCGEITLTPNHVCEQATQKKIDQMDKAARSDVYKSHRPLSVEDEITRLRAELAQSEKKCEEAVSDLEVLQTAYNNAETIVRRLVSRAEQSEQERDTAESAVSDLMNQIKVLQESLVKISNAEFAPEAGPKIHKDRQLWLRCRMEDEARDTLANLPVRAAAVEKVLEAAEEYVVSCQEEAMGPRFLEETNLFEAVRERREG